MVPLVDLLWTVLFATCAAGVVSAVLGKLLRRRAEAVRVEQAVAGGIMELALRPGDYVLPLVSSGSDSLRDTPVHRLTVTPRRTAAWLWEGHAAYHLAVNIMIAYLAGLALLPGTDFSPVFRFTTAVAFLGYASTSLHGWLSGSRSWRMVWRTALESLACSVVAGGIFACQWPAA